MAFEKSPTIIMKFLVSLIICLAFLLIWEIAVYTNFGNNLNTSAFLFFLSSLIYFVFISIRLLKKYEYQKLFYVTLLSLLSFGLYYFFSPKSEEPRQWHSYLGIEAGEPSEDFNGNIIYNFGTKVLISKKENWKEVIKKTKDKNEGIKTNWFIFKETGLDKGYEFPNNTNEQEIINNLNKSNYFVKGFFVFIEVIFITVLKYLLFLIIWAIIFQNTYAKSSIESKKAKYFFEKANP